MPAMLQDGIVIVVVAFVAVSLITETNSASSDYGKCRYCKDFIQSLLTGNNLLRIFEEKSSLAEKFFQDITQENTSDTSKLDFIKFCMDNCFVSGDVTENHEKNSIRSKRDVTEGIYKFFSPPFSHRSDDQSKHQVSETTEELEYGGKPYDNSVRVYQGYGKDKRARSGCECVKEQEESVKRLIQMVEKYTERIIEHFRGMLREEIKNQMVPQRQREYPSVGHQQNYFLLSFLTPNPPNPMEQYVKPEAFQTVETITNGHTVEDQETQATSETKTDLVTTDMPQKGTEYTEETTTEVTIDLPEASAMRQSDDELPPDCENRDQDSPQYLPALLQAFKPINI